MFYLLTPVVLTQIITSDERVRYFTLLSVFIMAGFGLSPVVGTFMNEASIFAMKRFDIGGTGLAQC